MYIAGLSAAFVDSINILCNTTMGRKKQQQNIGHTRNYSLLILYSPNFSRDNFYFVRKFAFMKYNREYHSL